ncbi:MAG: preprotein translocase subunit YajC [Phycisphaerae bacterium]|nr:preprotein translocase subunit YajC [Phycisphaerae bacterium]
MQSRKYLVWLCLAALVLNTSSLLAQPAPQPTDDEAAGRELGQNGADEGAAEATKEGQEDKTDEKKPPGQPGGEWFSKYGLFMIIGAFILFYIWMGRGRRKQQAKRKEMLASLKKGDKVTSIGGVVGTAIEVRENEVIVKVDETSNVRMRFARWAIRGVGEEAKIENPDQR